MTIDLTPPTDPNTLAWSAGANPSGGLTVNASWANGGEADIQDQTVNFYSDGTCTALDVGPIVIGGSVLTTQGYTRIAVNTRTTHSFDVTIKDNSGRTTNTICVPTPMIIDDQDPALATITGWDEAPLTGSANVTTTPTTSLSGLTPFTNYFVYYQADCAGNGLSEWVGPFNFLTGYCESIPASNDGDGITQAQLGSEIFPSAGDVVYSS